MHRIPNKIKRKIHALFALYFQVLQVIKNKNKNCTIELPYLLFIVISIGFTSVDIIFHNFLELH